MLTTDQTAERAACTEWQNDTIKTVTPNGDGTWAVTGESGWTFGGFQVPDGVAPPEVGDPYTLYGSFGRPIYGGDLRGVPCWFKTEAEREAEHQAHVAAIDARNREAYDAASDRLAVDLVALDPALQRRVARFVANCPQDWWVEFGLYEMAGLHAASAIAAAAKTNRPADPESWLTMFRDLGWKDQVELVPEAAGADSGNLFGYACQVASMLCLPDGEYRDLVLEWGHGAMVMLTGCDAYGCVQPPADVIARFQSVAP